MAKMGNYTYPEEKLLSAFGMLISLRVRHSEAMQPEAQRWLEAVIVDVAKALGWTAGLRGRTEPNRLHEFMSRAAQCTTREELGIVCSSYEETRRWLGQPFFPE